MPPMLQKSTSNIEECITVLRDLEKELNSYIRCTVLEQVKKRDQVKTALVDRRPIEARLYAEGFLLEKKESEKTIKNLSRIKKIICKLQDRKLAILTAEAHSGEQQFIQLTSSQTSETKFEQDPTDMETTLDIRGEQETPEAEDHTTAQAEIKKIIQEVLEELETSETRFEQGLTDLETALDIRGEQETPGAEDHTTAQAEIEKIIQEVSEELRRAREGTQIFPPVKKEAMDFKET